MASRESHKHVMYCLQEPFFCSLWNFMDENGLSPEQVAYFSFLMKDLAENKRLMEACVWKQETFDGKIEGGGRPKEYWPIFRLKRNAAEQSRMERSGTERSGTQQNGAERNTAEHNGTQRNGAERNATERGGAEHSGTQRNAAERGGAEHSGTQRNGAERSGTGRNAAERGGAEHSGT